GRPAQVGRHNVDAASNQFGNTRRHRDHLDFELDAQVSRYLFAKVDLVTDHFTRLGVLEAEGLRCAQGAADQRVTALDVVQCVGGSGATGAQGQYHGGDFQCVFEFHVSLRRWMIAVDQAADMAAQSLEYV